MKSWDFCPCATPAKRQYCRSTNTPECAITVARKRACRSVNPSPRRWGLWSDTTSRKVRWSCIVSPQQFVGQPAAASAATPAATTAAAGKAGAVAAES